MGMHERSSRITTSARALAIGAALVVASVLLAGRASAQDTPSQPAGDADSARAYAAPSSISNAQRVRRVLDDGTHIVLNDGTIWEVYLPDRPTVNVWRPGDLLTVREAPVMQGDYDYTIRDGRTRGIISARLVGDSSGRS